MATKNCFAVFAFTTERLEIQVIEVPKSPYFDWKRHRHNDFIFRSLPMDEVLNFRPLGTENQVFETPRKEFLLFFYCSFLNFRALGSNFTPKFNL